MDNPPNGAGPPADAAASEEMLRSLGFSDTKAALKNIGIISGIKPFAPHIGSVAGLASLAPSPDGALNNLENIVKDLPEETLGHFLEAPENLQRLITIAGSSPFLSNILAKDPANFEWLFMGRGLFETKDAALFLSELEKNRTGVETFDGMARALRLFKQREFLRIGSRDLLNLSPVEEVTAELSDLASAALDAALAFSIEHLKKSCGAPVDAGTGQEAGLAVIGMGKLGGRELNFSSDIDVIFVYSSSNGETAGVDGKDSSRISNHAFFVRASVLITKLISAVTEDGFVFRCDLDLRPEGRGGEMASSIYSAELYYESWGQPWERAAMIKARPVAGDKKTGADFLEMIRPFVFRRHLDFTAIEEIKAMKEKIDVGLLRRSTDAVDVKLGRGGIREIEFFCQALQLIHGGKDAGVRDKNTLQAIEKLREKGLLNHLSAATFRDGYVFLRRLEHRIQIVEGAQSQAVPKHAAELRRLARMMGFKDAPGKSAVDAFQEEYDGMTGAVHEVYRSLFYKSEEGPPEVPDEIRILFSDPRFRHAGAGITEDDANARLQALGFKDASAAYKNLCLLKDAPARMRIGSKGQMRLERLLPAFIARAAASPDPDMALAHIERFISAVGPRSLFYSLLGENPAALDKLITLFGSSAFLSRGIIERPESLDMLLSKELSVPYKTKAAFFREFLDEANSAAKDYEEKLGSMRELRNQEVLRIGVNDVFGSLTAHQVSMQMTFLAEAALEAAYELALGELKKTYGLPPPADARFAVIGMGKLGGRELIYGSDLDVIFVYSGGDADSRTDGARPISSHEFFVKLGQRIISVLTLRTKEGSLFSVDTRLRPSGSSGPLVAARPALIKYHMGGTSIWERQALIKARSVAGDAAFGEEVLKELGEALYARPLRKDDVREMLRIRSRMETEIAKEDRTRYNVKTGRGAAVDIEFLTQALQLLHGRRAGLRTQYTSKALARLRGEGIISPGDYAVLKDAYVFYRLLETRLRIVHDRPEGYLYTDPAGISSLAKRAGYAGEDAAGRLLEDYKNFSDKVRDIYIRTLEQAEADAE
ncbi:MAG: bifunctional [glutamate--ammonia ligase]-adenylyl-L-tyrosine phosphorylase/[glutamate--ammonia-ligase] adenylyltransferase [Deltaproteobacteria bacterium]|nr:bifunctional [glutamate--ammonia ligase]-adenylyl-L-tyrosine phosphorylase/[glutamate--ammonia-ligase] adenylyltransferase [Deltaproteobacteria bacterium]